MNRFDFSAESLGFTEDFMGPATWRAAIAELVGTLLFVFVGAGAVVTVTGVLPLKPVTSVDGGQLVAIALAHGLAIAVIVAATARISGGHINPAVTLATVITGRLKAAVGLLYIVSQLTGAVLGAFLLHIVITSSKRGDLGAHALNTDALSSHFS